MMVGWAAPPAAAAGNHDQNSKLERLGLSVPARTGSDAGRGPSSRAPLEGSESEPGSDSDTLAPNLNRRTRSASGSESLARACAAGLVKPATQTGTE